ncbi:MAG: hypothetical protein ABIU77_14620 [Ferruginibacter sp.]
MSNSAVQARDAKQLDSLTKSFFNLFTNKGKKKIDLSFLQVMCIPEALFIKKIGVQQVIYNLDSFIEPRLKMLTDGTLIEFEEKEIKSETQMVGNVAHRYVSYQKSGYLQDVYFMGYGTKFFQFIKTEKGWQIASLIWEDD